jgi:Domain of unknown function (DUF4382)
MMLRQYVYTSAVLAGLLAALTGCSGDGGSASTDGNGTLTLGLIDGPVEGAAQVVVAFKGIELKPASGAALDPIAMDASACDDFDDATGTCYINLLDLVGPNRRVVFSRALPAGHYEWVRLLVDAERNVMDSYLMTLDGRMCSLSIPSGSQTGLKIVSGVTVTANAVSDYTLDFDVRKSISNPPGLSDPDLQCAENYVLKPAIRIVDSTEVGAIAGTVDESVLSADASCVLDALGRYDNVAVYVYEDPAGTTVADDIDGDDGDPLTSASVVWDDGPQAYRYEAGFLLAPAGYHLGLTCTADIDDGAVDDYDPAMPDAQNFHFVAEQSVDVDVDATSDGSFNAGN